MPSAWCLVRVGEGACDKEADKTAAAAHVENAERFKRRGAEWLGGGEFSSDDLRERKPSIVYAAMAEAAGKTRKHELLPARDARGPDGGKVTHTVRVVLYLRKKVIPVALAAIEFELKTLWVQ